jgi:hypothetical protein
MAGWAGWIRTNLVPFRDLVREWQCGVVVVGTSATWIRPFQFFDTDVLEATTAVKVSAGGEILMTDTRFVVDGSEVASALGTLRPIRITDASLAARPGALPEELLQRFNPDEIAEPPPRSHMRSRVADISARGEHLESSTHPFRVHRADTEVADQWSFIDIPDHAAAAREELILSTSHPLLGGSLARSLTDVEVAISRPLFVFDSARVATDAYSLDGGQVFVHRIESDAAGGRVHATIVERLAS